MKRSECRSRELAKAHYRLRTAAERYAYATVQTKGVASASVLADYDLALRVAARSYSRAAELLKIEED